jgi:hypothetical protein
VTDAIATVRPALEVADIVCLHGPAFLARHGSSLSTTQRRALADVAACRTAVLGGHVQRCADCGQQDIAYNSCRNRHCPKFQGGRTGAWLQREAACLLPVPYFHVVFTLPAAVGQLVWQHRRLGYTLLFQAAQQTLRTVAADDCLRSTNGSNGEFPKLESTFVERPNYVARNPALPSRNL